MATRKKPAKKTAYKKEQVRDKKGKAHEKKETMGMKKMEKMRGMM